MSHVDSHSEAGPRQESRRSSRWLVGVIGVALLGASAYLVSARRHASVLLNDMVAPAIEPPALVEKLSVEPSAVEMQNERCEETLRGVMAAKAMPGTPRLMKNRMKILGRVKAEPVIFIEPPKFDQNEVRPRVREIRTRLEHSHPFTVLKELRGHFLDFHQDARESLLKDGYLYAEEEELAFAIATQIGPQHLFGHDRIWLQRGNETFWGVRNKNGSYDYADGELAGEPIKLLPWDRVGTGTPPARVLHRELRSIQYALHFSKMEIRHITESHVVANLRYGKWWVPTVLASNGAKLEFVCDVADGRVREDVTRIRDEETRRKRALSSVRDAILAQVDEKLPFDEPKHEYGEQLDGKLRKNWRHAYSRRMQLYEFNTDKYAVYDERGRPHVPQVCVDFLMDTFERASGTWYTPRGQAPGRNVGKLDFAALHQVDILRQVSGFVSFTKTHPEMFDVYTPPWQKRVKLGVFPVFMDYLVEYSDEYQSGDMILIQGKTPWDPNKSHYHSFIVYESDPVTGAPLYVAGNPGRPVIRAWETEALRTPLRKIVLRIRPRLEWLESIVTVDREKVPTPPSLGPGRG